VESEHGDVRQEHWRVGAARGGSRDGKVPHRSKARQAGARAGEVREHRARWRWWQGGARTGAARGGSRGEDVGDVRAIESAPGVQGQTGQVRGAGTREGAGAQERRTRCRARQGGMIRARERCEPAHAGGEGARPRPGPALCTRARVS